MVKSFSLLVAVIVGVVLLAYMFVFQVRYDEQAVVTTFNRATAASVITQAGPQLRWPWPIQNVQTYSTLLQLYEPPAEEIQVGDGASVVPHFYLAWRIDNALDFYNSMRTVDRAKETLKPILKEEFTGQLGKYNFDQLVNLEKDKIKLAVIEDQVLKGLQAKLASLKYGIRAEQVGIPRLLLPEANTSEVFDSMRKTRERMAAEIRAQGEARARAIESNADNARTRILAFADRRAKAIVAEGMEQAVKYYETFKLDENLAIVLRRIETLKAVLAKNATIVVNSSQIGAEEITGPKSTPKP
jgi:modulator of FtsH protease HflC